MTSVSNRRSMMGLYSGNMCIRSHQVRFVLSEKGIVTKIDNFDGKKIPEDLIEETLYKIGDIGTKYKPRCFI